MQGVIELNSITPWSMHASQKSGHKVNSVTTLLAATTWCRFVIEYGTIHLSAQLQNQRIRRGGSGIAQAAMW